MTDHPPGLGRTYDVIEHDGGSMFVPWFMRAKREIQQLEKEEAMEAGKIYGGKPMGPTQPSVFEEVSAAKGDPSRFRIAQKLKAVSEVCDQLLRFEGADRVWVLARATELLEGAD